MPTARRSSAITSSTAGRQDPHPGPEPAPQARATAPREQAPARTAARTRRSETDLQWQTITASFLPDAFNVLPGN